MSYNEAQWQKHLNNQAHDVDKTAIHKAIYESKRKTPQDFVEIYSRALLEYLNSTYGTNKSHIVDLATQATAFAEVFYLTVEALA
jgi:hypothetical protein